MLWDTPLTKPKFSTDKSRLLQHTDWQERKAQRQMRRYKLLKILLTKRILNIRMPQSHGSCRGRPPGSSSNLRTTHSKWRCFLWKHWSKPCQMQMKKCSVRPAQDWQASYLWLVCLLVTKGCLCSGSLKVWWMPCLMMKTNPTILSTVQRTTLLICLGRMPRGS